MTILFAVNMAEPADVCRRVADLADRLGARLLVLHVHASSSAYTVVDPIAGLGEASYTPFDPKVQESLDQAEAQAFQQFLGQSFERPVDASLRKGRPADAILQDATDHDVDLLVVGKRHHSRIEKFLMGDTATEVVERSDRPVLLVPIRDE
jgi:nucleotide-binding universal stress UspA family protein